MSTATIEVKTISETHQVLLDAEGNKTGVFIPINDYENMIGILEKMLLREKMKNEFKASLEDAKKIAERNDSGMSLKDFLDEL